MKFKPGQPILVDNKSKGTIIKLSHIPTSKYGCPIYKIKTDRTIRTVSEQRLSIDRTEKLKYL